MSKLLEAIKDFEERAAGVTSPDEVVALRNELREAESYLEDVTVTCGNDSLWLKWGTLKAWDLKSERGQELLKQYFALGSSMGAAQQNDTDEQKKLICEMIDEADCPIGNDWEGTYMTKAEAKEYVLNYGKFHE